MNCQVWLIFTLPPFGSISTHTRHYSSNYGMWYDAEIIDAYSFSNFPPDHCLLRSMAWFGNPRTKLRVYICNDLSHFLYIYFKWHTYRNLVCVRVWVLQCVRVCMTTLVPFQVLHFSYLHSQINMHKYTEAVLNWSLAAVSMVFADIYCSKAITPS